MILRLQKSVLSLANKFYFGAYRDANCRCMSDSEPRLCLQLKLVRLVGMMLVVFVRRNISNNIRGMRAGTIGTGIMGMMVGVRIVECWLSKSPPGKIYMI